MNDGKISVSELKEFLFIDNPKYPSFLIRENNGTVGYCFLTRYKKRQACDRTAKVSIYLKPGCTGKGTGTIAMKSLEDDAANAGIRVLIGTLCGENRESIRLVEMMKYTKCAHLKNIGETFGNFLDVVMYQKEICED